MESNHALFCAYAAVVFSIFFNRKREYYNGELFGDFNLVEMRKFLCRN